MHYRSPLSTARGLGSAKSGTQHWWFQRVSSVALALLSFWVVVFLNLVLHSAYPEIISWLKMPFNAAALIAWLVTAFYHAALGLQVVIEDYVSHDGIKIFSIWMIKLLMLFLALTALLAVFRIIFTG